MNCIAGLGVRSILRLSLVSLALLGFVFPTLSRADSITNVGGNIQGSSAGLTLSSNVNGVNAVTGLGTLGGITITTGALTGSLSTGGTFNGGTVTVTANANGIAQGLPPGHGAVFTGTFSGPVSWMVQITSTPQGLRYTYTLTGALSGTLYTGGVFGGTTQITVVLTKPFTGAKVGLQGGTTSLAAVPEPGTFGLLGSGLIGMAGLVRRRLTGSWSLRSWRT